MFDRKVYVRLEHEINDISKLHFHSCIWGRRGRDRMVVRFTTTMYNQSLSPLTL